MSNLFAIMDAALQRAKAEWSLVSALSLGLSGVNSSLDVTEYSDLVREGLRRRNAPKEVSSSASVLARMSDRSRGKLLIFIIYKK